MGQKDSPRINGVRWEEGPSLEAGVLGRIPFQPLQAHPRNLYSGSRVRYFVSTPSFHGFDRHEPFIPEPKNFLHRLGLFLPALGVREKGYRVERSLGTLEFFQDVPDFSHGRFHHASTLP